MMWILFALICILVGFFANKKFNRNFWIWSFIAFLFSPLFTIIILIVLEYVIYTSAEQFSRKMMDLYKLYKNNVINQEDARELFEDNGFKFEKYIETGSQHYGFVLTKNI